MLRAIAGQAQGANRSGSVLFCQIHGMADTDDTKATKVAALGGPEASPEASEAKEHALDRKASSDDEADEAEADAAAEPTTDATADEPSSDSPPAAAAAAASAASGAGTSASAAAAVDDADKEEEDKLAIYRTASTAGRGYVVCYGWMTKQVRACGRWVGAGAAAKVADESCPSCPQNSSACSPWRHSLCRPLRALPWSICAAHFPNTARYPHPASLRRGRAGSFGARAGSAAFLCCTRCDLEAVALARTQRLPQVHGKRHQLSGQLKPLPAAPRSAALELARARGRLGGFARLQLDEPCESERVVAAVGNACCCQPFTTQLAPPVPLLPSAAQVPHGSVLVYYNTNKPEADNIMGYVDLRQVTSVSLTRQNIGGSDRDAIEIVTVPRTYYVCPATVQRSVASSSSGSCINILGWPVSELEVTPQYDAEKEGFATQRRVLQTWLKNLEVACKFKAATMHAEVTTETDSTTVLPDKVYIMVTPSDVVLLDGSVKDKAYACWPYRDLASWRAESRKNLQINVRSVSSTIRCTFSVEENVPRDAGGLTFGTTAFELKKRIDEHIQALVELRKAGEKV